MVSLIWPPKSRLARKPAEILLVVMRSEFDAQLFGIEPALFQLSKVGHRPIFSWDAVQPSA